MFIHNSETITWYALIFNRVRLGLGLESRNRGIAPEKHEFSVLGTVVISLVVQFAKVN